MIDLCLYDSPKFASPIFNKPYTFPGGDLYLPEFASPALNRPYTFPGGDLYLPEFASPALNRPYTFPGGDFSTAKFTPAMPVSDPCMFNKLHARTDTTALGEAEYLNGPYTLPDGTHEEFNGHQWENFDDEDNHDNDNDDWHGLGVAKFIQDSLIVCKPAFDVE